MYLKYQHKIKLLAQEHRTWSMYKIEQGWFKEQCDILIQNLLKVAITTGMFFYTI